MRVRCGEVSYIMDALLPTISRRQSDRQQRESGRMSSVTISNGTRPSTEMIICSDEIKCPARGLISVVLRISSSHLVLLFIPVSHREEREPSTRRRAKHAWRHGAEQAELRRRPLPPPDPLLDPPLCRSHREKWDPYLAAHRHGTSFNS